ncbi:MAG: hypothetical protein ACD_54C00928G0001 [uncultured bacterium]|nr:MAG: hypothetical protein ACD_54C00928G0001 [uncultured bacterium]
MISAQTPPNTPKLRGRSKLSQSDSAIGAHDSKVATEAQASRLSQLLRHWLNARHARHGLPR